MQNKKLIVTIIGFLLLASTFAVLSGNAAQPPIATTSYYVGTIGQPYQCDPSLAYDTASGELIMNVYETLMFFSDKNVPVVPLNQSVNMENEEAADLSQFSLVLASAMSISADNETWTFTIDTSIDWQPWQDHLGAWHNQKLSVADVEYSFKRLLVQDNPAAPSWMLCKPLTGYMFFDELDADPDTNTIEPVGAPGNTTYGEKAVQTLIEGAITLGPGPNDIQFHMVPGKAWPVSAFEQILSQTWSSICNKDFCIEHGCWDGLFTDDWSTVYRQMPSLDFTPLDAWMDTSSYPEDTGVPAMCGTGPYVFNYWHKEDLEYNVFAWENGLHGSTGYRGGWNAAGSINSLKTITVKGIAEWSTRKMMFLAGDSDNCAVPRANMWDLLQAGEQYLPLAGLQLYYNSPALSLDCANFVFRLSATSPYLPKVGGVPQLYFFNDSRVRRAFCNALDFATYLAGAWWGEAIQPTTWWVKGLAPDYEDKTIAKYSLSYANMQTEFTAAGLWTTGFEVTLAYNLGNDQRKIACEMMRDAIQALNVNRTSLTPFKVNVIGLDWPVFLSYRRARWLGMYYVGWLADFADPDNFCRPFMHTQGDYSRFQPYGNSTTDALIDSGITMANGAPRNATYQTIQQIYHYDSPGLPLVQAVGRRWTRNWMKGWYLNQLYPGGYWYDLWKSTMPAPTIIDLDATHSVLDVPAYLASLGYGNTIEIAYPYGTDFGPNVNVSFTVSRNDAVNASVPAVMAVTYIAASTGYEIAIDAYDVLIGPAPANVTEYFLLNVPSQVIGLYNVTGKVYVFSEAYEDDTMGNNVDQGGQYNATWLLGDVNNDRIVEMMDFFDASNAFNSAPGSTNWNKRCDIYGPATDPTYAGDGMVEMMDFWVLSAQYNQHLPMPL
jgi:peptide/nickel transport system substrate-binding protein